MRVVNRQCIVVRAGRRLGGLKWSAAGAWRGAIRLRSGRVPPIGGPARAVTAARREREGRARRDTDGDAGAGVGPRPPAGPGTPGVRGRAPFA